MGDGTIVYSYAVHYASEILLAPCSVWKFTIWKISEVLLYKGAESFMVVKNNDGKVLVHYPYIDSAAL